MLTLTWSLWRNSLPLPALWARGPSGRMAFGRFILASFFVMFFCIVFSCIYDGSWPPFWCHFQCLLHYFFEHRFYMDLSSIMQRISCIVWIGFLLPWSYVQLVKPSKTGAFTLLLHGLPFRKHIFFQNVRDIWRCSWRCSLLHQSMLGSFWLIWASKLKFVRYRISNNFLVCCLTPFGN